MMQLSKAALFTALLALSTSGALGQYGGAAYSEPSSPASSPATPPVSPVPPGASPKTLQVNPWNIPSVANIPPYADMTANVGDSAQFTWQDGPHGLYKIPSGTCPSFFENNPDVVSIAEPRLASSATVNFTAPGDYWYACPVDGHCLAGMKIKFTVA